MWIDLHTGHINLSLFWKNLAGASLEEQDSAVPLEDGPLQDAIATAFGSLDNLEKDFIVTTAYIQGNRGGWLVRILHATLSKDRSLLVVQGCATSKLPECWHDRLQGQETHQLGLNPHARPHHWP